MSVSAPAFSTVNAKLTHSTGYAVDWRDRFAEAYWRQNRAFLHFVRTGEFSPIAADCWDGYAAAIVGEAGVRALNEGCKVAVEMAAKPGFYVRGKESVR